MNSISNNSDNISNGSDGSNGSTGKNNDEDVAVSKEFQENVIKFVKLDDLMKKKTQEMSELRTQRKPCEDFILKYLDQIGEQVIEINTGKLRKNKSETKIPLNQDIIKEAIETVVKDPKLVAQIMEHMDDSRPKNTRVNLKRTAKREASKKKNKKAISKATKK